MKFSYFLHLARVVIIVIIVSLLTMSLYVQSRVYTVIIPIWSKVWLAHEWMDGRRKLWYGLKGVLLMNVFESPVLQSSFLIFLWFIYFWSYILKSSTCLLLWISTECQNLFLLNFWTNWARNSYHCTQFVARFKSFPNVIHFFMLKRS